jgi:hypothetical protein
MRRTIGFNDQSRMVAGDVGVVRPNLHLPPKVIPLLSESVQDVP